MFIPLIPFFWLPSNANYWPVPVRQREDILQISRILDTCPGTWDWYPAQGEGSGTVASKVELAMRQLQPYDTSTIRLALCSYCGTIWERFENGSLEKEPVNRSLLRAETLGPAYWVGRFLFNAPPGSFRNYSGPLPLRPAPTDKPGPLATACYPVQFSPTGTVRIAQQNFMFGDSPGDPILDFDYFASHYPRRSKWWK